MTAELDPQMEALIERFVIRAQKLVRRMSWESCDAYGPPDRADFRAAFRHEIIGYDPLKGKRKPRYSRG